MRILKSGLWVLALATIALVAEGVTRHAHAGVSVPKPGLILVTNPGRATLVVSLCHPGISVRTTKWGENNRTAQSYANLLGLSAAVNADFFNFPSATKVVGKARGDGIEWPATQTGLYNEVRHYWQFGPQWAQGVIHDSVPYHAGVTDVVGGHDHIIRNGAVFSAWPNHDFYTGAKRRTGIGLSQDQRWLYITAVGGGAGHVQLAQHMVADAAEAGAPPIYQASNMDGGGSSQLWVNGSWAISSTRKVANHVGIYTNSTRHSSCRPFYAAEFVSSTLPVQGTGTITLNLGEVVTGTVRFRNKGTETWNANTKLAPIPRDQASPLAAPGWLNPSRMSNISGSVPPGAVGTFAVSFKGNSPGTRVQQFGLLHELFTWFAQAPLGGGPADGSLKYRVVVNDCTPSCAGKQCGGDGCGGSCGSCGAGTTCTGGQCVCVPQCSSKECGGDSCGGSCGACGAGTTCSGGQCVCAPQCSGKECGGDGCGGSCGSCGAGTTCSGGECVCAPQCSGKECGGDTCGGSCGSCPATHACSGGQCVCEPQCDGKPCGDDGCGGDCGPCPTQHVCQVDACVCIPDCSQKECGSDGCGGSCGGCPDWESCNSNFLCECAPSMEVCDNVDNDCDGTIDEDDVCGGGSCFPGTERPCDYPELPVDCDTGVQYCGTNAFWGPCELPEDCLDPVEPDVTGTDDAMSDVDADEDGASVGDTDADALAEDTSTGQEHDTGLSPDTTSDLDPDTDELLLDTTDPTLDTAIDDTGGTGVDVVTDLTTVKVPIDNSCQGGSSLPWWWLLALGIVIALRRRNGRRA